MKKLYILNFNPAAIDTDMLHDAIKSSNMVINWSHYLTDSYIIQSENTAKELSMELREKMGGDFTHMIFRLEKNYYGYMPKKQWAWLKRRSDWWDKS